MRALFAVVGLFSVLPDPVLQPVDPNAALDLTVLLHDTLEIFRSWKSGGAIVGLTAVVYFLTMLSKNVWVLSAIPKYLRPWVALAIGIISGSVGALASGAHFWPSAVMTGLAAGFGSVAFDQLLKNPLIDKLKLWFKSKVVPMPAPPSTTTTATLVAVFVLALFTGSQAGCAFWTREQGALEKCGIDAVARFLPMLGQSPVPVSLITAGGQAAECVVDAVVSFEEAQGNPIVIGLLDAGVLTASAQPWSAATKSAISLQARHTIYVNAKEIQQAQKK